MVDPTAVEAGATDTPKEEKKISGGAIAGAAVGSIVGLAFIGVGALILYRVHKKRREASEDDDIPHMTGVQVPDKQYPPHQVPYPHSTSNTLTSSQY